MNDGQGAQQKMPAGGRIKSCILCVTLMLAGAGTVYAAGNNQGAVSDEGIPGVLKYAQQYQREKEISSVEQKRPASSGLDGIAGNTELRRRLTIREQELRQLKKENQSLRGRLDSQSVAAQKVEENKAGLVSSLNVLKKEMAEMPVVTPELLTTESAQLAYAAGVMLGRDMLNIQAAQQQLGLKTDNRVLLAGIRDALNRKVLLNESALDSALQKAEGVAQKARLVVIREQEKAGAAYLDNFRKQKGVKQAESGFWYRTEYAGDGEFIRGDDTRVDVVVTEKLTDGTVIEDMDARGRVISQALSDYPLVFREALMLLKNHGTAELVVPPELAYGDEGDPPRVPPGATMLYTLRVEGVKPAAGEAPESSSEAGWAKTGKGAEGDNK